MIRKISLWMVALVACLIMTGCVIPEQKAQRGLTRQQQRDQAKAKKEAARRAKEDAKRQKELARQQIEQEERVETERKRLEKERLTRKKAQEKKLAEYRKKQEKEMTARELAKQRAQAESVWRNTMYVLKDDMLKFRIDWWRFWMVDRPSRLNLQPE